MNNLLLGASGSGKSYEAVRYHVLNALKKGRKVITNLPLNIDEFNKIDPNYGELIELRKKTKPKMGNWQPGIDDKAFAILPENEWTIYPANKRIFSHVWDFYDEWRHPVTNTGAIFVIDEAQNVIPRTGTDQQLVEWDSLHRHWFNDVIYITQSYGKLNADIRDNCQTVYRFRKMVAWGQPTKYIRKVLDGIKGVEIDVQTRSYEKQFFPLYRSHTQAEGSGEESNATDIKPIWKHWSFFGAGISLLILIGILASGKVHNPFNPTALKTVENLNNVNKYKVSQFDIDKAKHNESNNANRTASAVQPSNNKTNTVPILQTLEDEPLIGKTIHIQGRIRNKQRDVYFLAIAQNGQSVFKMSSDDLRNAGYEFKPISDCLALLTYGKKIIHHLSCDAPTQSVQNLPTVNG